MVSLLLNRYVCLFVTTGVLNDTKNRRTRSEQDGQQRGFQVAQRCSFHSSASFWDSLRFKSMNMVIGSYYYHRKPLLIFEDYGANFFA